MAQAICLEVVLDPYKDLRYDLIYIYEYKDNCECNCDSDESIY